MPKKEDKDIIQKIRKAQEVVKALIGLVLELGTLLAVFKLIISSL